MKHIYSLKNDKRLIHDINNASRTSNVNGFRNTHGWFGSQEWWDNIASQNLPTITLKGYITKLSDLGYNDYPVFEMKCEDGTEYSFERAANFEDYRQFYKIGHKIIVNYVIQKFKRAVLGKIDNKVILDVWVSENE